MIESYLAAFWSILLASAPALLLGFFLAGLVRRFLPTEKIVRHLAQDATGSVWKASAVGVPLPLCSCSVIPVAVSLRRAGAGRGATASFLISTPEIGVDSFILSYVFLGPFLSIVRVFSAFFSALCVGLAVDRYTADEPNPNKTSPAKVTPACCGGSEKPLKEKTSIRSMLHFSFVELVEDLAPTLAIGFALSALITIALPSDLIGEFSSHSYASELLQMVFALVVSLPLYICAASSTPIAAALLAKGVSAAAIVVFLIAGPASNITTMLAVRNELGTRALAIYISGITLCAFVFGFGAAQILDHYPAMIPNQSLAHSHESASLGIFCAVILVTLFVFTQWTKRRAKKSCCA